MKGFTSTSLNKDYALKFSDNSKNPDKIPVLLVINLTKFDNLFQITEDYTYFRGEDEVLLNEGKGLEFKV